MKKRSSYRLLLINPRYRYPHYATMLELAVLAGKKKMTAPHQLQLLAALTPSHYDVRIVDEDIEELPRRPRPDLVGLTVLSATSDRAFQIADQYRHQGVPVVVGGPHPTCQTEEALQHADSVIVGEAEGVWAAFLADFERGSLRPVYRSSQPCSFRTSPPPRWDVVHAQAYMSAGVETSRGCPFGCVFCVAHRVFGRTMRFRDIDDVVREIRLAPRNKSFFFLSDNFALNRPYALELVERLTPLKVNWVCQTSIQVSADPELLRAMARAGCTHVLIGFESVNAASLRKAHKFHNHLEQYETAIRRVHAAGMHLMASFIVGFDDDTPESFQAIADFVQRQGLVYPLLNSLSVAPGTAIYDDFQAAGRIRIVEPSFRNGMFPSARYAHLRQEEMLDCFMATLRQLFSWELLADRALRLFSTGAFARPTRGAVPWSLRARTLARVLQEYPRASDPYQRWLFWDFPVSWLAETWHRTRW